MLHQKEQSKKNDNAAYFKLLVNEYYPKLLIELEDLHQSIQVMEEEATVPQLFLEKLINAINALWRAEKHYWQMADNLLDAVIFPKEYVLNKQQFISNHITHLRSLLFSDSSQEDRKDVLVALADYTEIEYKLNGLFIEKERRIYEISAGESS